MSTEINLNTIQDKIATVNYENGFRDRWHHLHAEEAPSEAAILDHIGAKLALITSEVGEAVDALRQGRDGFEFYTMPGGGEGHGPNLDDAGNPRNKPDGLVFEVVDVIIRSIDLLDMLNVNVAGAIDTKLRYNAQRGRMHGGKKL